MKKIIVTLFALAITTGCVSTSIKPEAFGGKKRYAIISIIGSKTIGEYNNGQNSGPSLVGLISAASSEDVNVFESSDKILAKTAKIADSVFSKAKSMKYVSTKKLLRSRAYKNAKGSEPKFGIIPIGLAKGFKYFKDENKAEVAKILKANHLDGAIILNGQYYYTKPFGVNVLGIIEAGNIKGYVVMDVSAVDKGMNEVWRQRITIESDNGVGTVGGVPNYKKLYPILEETTKSTLMEAVKTLDTTVLSKK